MNEDANKELAADASIENTALDAIELLEADHRVAKQLFDAFEKAGDSDLEAKGTLARRACEVLTVHTMIEENILYPAAHKALGKDDEIDVDEAYVEHFLAKSRATMGSMQRSRCCRRWCSTISRKRNRASFPNCAKAVSTWCGSAR